MRELSYYDVTPLLARLDAVERQDAKIVLVGGQAVNFWAERYADRDADLAAGLPYTSRDIDFCGDVRAVRIFAALLEGEAQIDDSAHASPFPGIVIYVDAEGNKRQLDVVDRPYGLAQGEVEDLAIPAEILNEDGTGTGRSFYVIHPVLSLESRVHNVMGLPGDYDTPHGRKQMRAALTCAREFLRDILADDELDAKERVRAVLKLNERIFKFALGQRGCGVFATHSLDLIDAMLIDPTLPEQFLRRRHPQMLAALAAKRRG